MRRRWIVGLLLLLCVLGGAALIHRFWLQGQETRHRELHELVAALHLEIERYAMDNDGDYPPDLKTLLRKQNFQLPDNPYRTGEIKILAPADPFEPGGLVYISWGPTLATDSGPVHAIENFIILGYSSRRQHGVKEVVERNYEAATGQPVDTLPPAVSQIDWQHVEVVKFPWYINPGHYTFPQYW